MTFLVVVVVLRFVIAFKGRISSCNKSRGGCCFEWGGDATR